MKLVLIRGVPGSGKSTLAKQMKGYQHFEADMFFTDESGVYKYDASRIKQSHEWCQNMTDAALQIGSDVVVSNTFTRRFEIQPYIDMANRYGADLKIITATGNYKNVHGVPDEIIQKMRDRWEEV